MLKKYYLGGFFWAPIPVKQYQNTSGFAGVYEADDPSKLPISASFGVKRVLGYALLRNIPSY